MCSKGDLCNGVRFPYPHMIPEAETKSGVETKAEKEEILLLILLFLVRNINWVNR